MRKNLFFAMAEKQWPIIALEQEGVSLEDVFIKLTDVKATKEQTKRRGGRR